MISRDGLHLVDAADDLTAERDRRFHVAAEVEVLHPREDVEADVLLALERGRPLRCAAHAARAG